MSETVSIMIDGRNRKAEKGRTVLEVAKEMGIEIPTLCYHEALTPIGSCRLCVVEVKQGGRTRTMASCVTPVADGMVVRTETKLITGIRRMIITLLLARCPDIEIIRQKAKELGVKTHPFPKDKEDCYLCGMCVRACKEIVGVGAIGVGCGTCTTICPARTFDLKKVFARRSLHSVGGSKDTFRCIVCETHYGSP